MLDKILAFIANVFTVKSTTVPAGTYLSLPLRVRKRSGIVTIAVMGLQALPGNATTTVGTVPEGYRPLIDTEFDTATADGARRLRVSVRTNGNIDVANYGTTASGVLNARAPITYIGGVL